MSFVGDPGKYAAAVTPSDVTNFPDPARSLYIGVTGAVSLVDLAGNPVVFSNVPVGFMSMQCLRVNATGTTATGILRVWG